MLVTPSVRIRYITSSGCDQPVSDPLSDTATTTHQHSFKHSCKIYLKIIFSSFPYPTNKMKMKLSIWRNKYKVHDKVKTASKKKSNIKILSYRNLKSKLRTIVDNNTHLMRFARQKMEEKQIEEAVYGNVSNDYIEMTARRRSCDKSLMAILQSARRELDTSAKYESMCLETEERRTEEEESGPASSPCENIYEYFDL